MTVRACRRAFPELSRPHPAPWSLERGSVRRRGTVQHRAMDGAAPGPSSGTAGRLTIGGVAAIQQVAGTHRSAVHTAPWTGDGGGTPSLLLRCSQGSLAERVGVGKPTGGTVPDSDVRVGVRDRALASARALRSAAAQPYLHVSAAPCTGRLHRGSAGWPCRRSIRAFVHGSPSREDSPNLSPTAPLKGSASSGRAMPVTFAQGRSGHDLSSPTVSWLTQHPRGVRPGPSLRGRRVPEVAIASPGLPAPASG